MNLKNPFYGALGVSASRKEQISMSKKLGCSIKELDYLDTNCILPSRQILKQIQLEFGVTELEIRLKMGIYDLELKKIISNLSIDHFTSQFHKTELNDVRHQLKYQSSFGQLYKGDCISLLSNIKDDTFDVVFADPPFNLNKLYPSGMNDNISHLEYIDWCQKWINECIRTLKPGGSLFLWNIPKWNTYFSEYLNQRLNFRHWIATDIKFSLPIQSKLYPSHYSLLYYTKGEKPNTYHADRLPMETCPKCYSDIKDYGGYKNKMNPKGINMSDVWHDIPPVRHAKYKARSGSNELSIKLLDRVIEMSTNPGDHIFDPFGGSGTTYIVAEIKKRKWTGIELGPIDDITDRFDKIKDEIKYLKKIRERYNKLFIDNVKAKRIEKGLWTNDSF